MPNDDTVIDFYILSNVCHIFHQCSAFNLDAATDLGILPHTHPTAVFRHKQGISMLDDIKILTADGTVGTNADPSLQNAVFFNDCIGTNYDIRPNFYVIW